MSLIDLAQSLNAEEVARRKADDERAHQSWLLERRRTIYAEYGRRWFESLGTAMREMASQFNKLTHDETKHLEVTGGSLFDLDRIRIRFKNHEPNEQEPCCALYRVPPDLRVSLAFRSVGMIFEEHFHVLPTEAFEIQVKVSKEREVRHVLWPEDQGRQTTGNIWDDMDISYEKVRSTEYLDVKQFSEYVLELFVTFRWGRMA